MRIFNRLILVVFFVLCISQTVYSATNISSLPFTCSIDSETYTVTTDLTTTGTAITVTADNVTIDLNGHTITWGTGNGTFTYGITFTAWNKNYFTVLSSSGTHGKLIHGATTNPADCTGIYNTTSIANVLIHDVDITVKSASDANDESDGIRLGWAGNIEIYNCIIDNQASYVVNRYSLPAVGIRIAGSGGTKTWIHDNTITSTHVGISALGPANSPPTTRGLRIYNNSVKINQCSSTNGYAIGAGNFNDSPGQFYQTCGTADGQICNNTINNKNDNGYSIRGGRGLYLGTLWYQDVFNNTIDVEEGPTDESYQGNGIRMRWQNFYNIVRNNTVTTYAGRFAKTITNCTNNGSGLIRVTCPNHGYSTDDKVFIWDVVGTTEANCQGPYSSAIWYWKITVIDSNTFDLTQDYVGNPSVFTHTYTSGGLVNKGSGDAYSLYITVSAYDVGWGDDYNQILNNTFIAKTYAAGRYAYPIYIESFDGTGGLGGDASHWTFNGNVATSNSNPVWLAAGVNAPANSRDVKNMLWQNTTINKVTDAYSGNYLTFDVTGCISGGCTGGSSVHDVTFCGTTFTGGASSSDISYSSNGSYTLTFLDTCVTEKRTFYGITSQGASFR